MFYHKSYLVILFLTANYNLFSADFTVTYSATKGVNLTLSDAEKMNIIIGSLDAALYQIIQTFQTTQNVDNFRTAIGLGIARHKAMLDDLHVTMHPNIVYLYFIEYSYDLCKYGLTAQYLATLSAEDRNLIITTGYNHWLTCYNNHLSANLPIIIDNVNAYFTSLLETP